MPQDVTSGCLDERILREERSALAARRNAAGFEKTGADGPRPYRDVDLGSDSVGLAVSGGGIRAASFGLGIIQAFYQRGLLRFCDYLSTVSGGSYVGAFLASLAHHQDSGLNWKRRESSTGGSESASRRLTLEPGPRGQQPEYVQRLIYGGSYLNRPLLFINNWLPGFLLINVVAISATVAVCSALAFLFRLMYRHDVGRVLSSLGFPDDISRAFFPATMVFLAWTLFLATNSVIAFLRGTRMAAQAAKRMTLALIVVTLICGVSLLGVGDVDTAMLRNWLGIDIPATWKEQIQSIAKWLFFTVVAVGILPYFTPERLLRSGASDNPRWGEREIFRMTTAALFWGCPLFIFALLARENVSYYNNTRPDRNQLTRSSIGNWDGFWGRVKADATYEAPLRVPPASPTRDAARVDPMRTLLARPSVALWRQLEREGLLPSNAASLSAFLASQTTPPTAALLIDEITLEGLKRRDMDRNASLLARWRGAVLWCFGFDSGNVFDALVDSEWKAFRDRELAVAYCNYMLLDPDFETRFADVSEALAVGAEGKRVADSPLFAGNGPKVVSAWHQAHDLSAGLSAAERSFINELRQSRLEVAKWAYWLARTDDGDRNYPAVQGQLTVARTALNQLLQNAANPLPRQRADQLAQVNFDLMQSFYGEKTIQPPQTVFASVVTDHDQNSRLWIAGIAFAIFLVTGLVDLNQTTLHNFYRDQLASVWIVKPDGEVDLPLARLRASAKGAPYLLVNCATSTLSSTKVDEEPTDTYVLSQAACGSERLGYAPTSEFDGGQFPLTLADAMAISGAAVTPVASRNFAVRALLWMLNFRLGQWLPNPAVNSLRQPPVLYRRIWRRPQPLHILLSKALLANQQQDFVFVCDGGLHDNLGIETLLLRRCRLIIAVDAEADPKGQFEGLVKLLLRVRVRHGITIVGLASDPASGSSPLPLEELCCARLNAAETAAQTAQSRRGGKGAPVPRLSRFFIARIKYPEDRPDNPAYLLYIRPNFLGDEWAELARYRAQNEKFPNDETPDQFYSPARFEAYRLLGEHIGDKVGKQLLDLMGTGDGYQALLEAVARLGKELHRPPAAPAGKTRTRANGVRKNAVSPLGSEIDRLLDLTAELRTEDARTAAREELEALLEKLREFATEKGPEAEPSHNGNGAGH
jgi:hypothetical protein